MDENPKYKLKVTGHSLGAALAHLTGMSLIKDGFKVSMINFGQPRLGNTAYAAFSDMVF
jgi:triacylglycerol lipase